MNKKTILKKACCDGKGGIVDNLKNVGGNVKKIIDSGVAGAKNTYSKNIKYDKSLGLEDPISKVQAGMKGVLGGVIGAAREAKKIVEPKQKEIKKDILKDVIQKATPITPGNFPTKSLKNKAGEIINPTAKDVAGFNSRFNTLRSPKK